MSSIGKLHSTRRNVYRCFDIVPINRHSKGELFAPKKIAAMLRTASREVVMTVGTGRDAPALPVDLANREPFRTIRYRLA